MSYRRELVSQIIATQYQTASNVPPISSTSHSHHTSKNCTLVSRHSFTRRHSRVVPTFNQHSVKWSPFLQTASRLAGPEEVVEVECPYSRCTSSQGQSKDPEDCKRVKGSKSILDYSVATTSDSPFSSFTKRYSDKKYEDDNAKFDTSLHSDKDVENPITFATKFAKDVLYANKHTTTRDRITKCHRDAMTVGFEITDAACGPSAGEWTTRNRSPRTSRASRATGQTIRFARQTPFRTTTPSRATSRATSRASSRASSETFRSSRASSRDRSNGRHKHNERILSSCRGFDRKQDKPRYSEYERSHGRPRHCHRLYEPERDPGPGSATRTNCSPGMECTKEYSLTASKARSSKTCCNRVHRSRPTQPEDTSIPERGRRILYNEGISDEVLQKWPNFKENTREVTPRAWDPDEPRQQSESKGLKTQGCGPLYGETYIPFSHYNPSRYHVECKREDLGRHHKADYRPPSPTYHPSTPYLRPPCCSLTRLTPAPRKVLASEQNVELFASMLGGESNWYRQRDAGWK